MAAIDILQTGGGKPQFVSDHTAIASLLSQGIPLKDARNYAPIGCIELAVPGLWARCNAGYLNLPKILELALNDGQDALTGKQVGPNTGCPGAFSSFQDLVLAYRSQLQAAIRAMVAANNIVDTIHWDSMPHLLISAFMPGCLETGRDVTAGGAKYNWTGPLAVGLANTGNALYAIKSLVYETGRYTMADLLTALAQNFAGWDNLHRDCLAAAKLGNDNIDVDATTDLVAQLFYDEIERLQDIRGGRYVPGMYSLTANIPLGKATAAGADGRLTGSPLAEGISPAQGTDRNDIISRTEHYQI